jgi:transposase
MEEQRGTDRAGRRRKRFLTPQEKYEIWLQLVRGESTIAEAADRAGVDRASVMKLRTVAKEGVLDALAASRPGARPGKPDPELQAARAEIARLSETVKEQAVELMLLRGKGGRWG